MPRSSWKGYLKLSLVSVPIRGYTANVAASEIRLHQLHAECHSRIRYQKTCPIHGAVPNDEIVSGYEYSKGRYVELEPDELDKLRSHGDRSLTIDTFISPDELDVVYLAARLSYLSP